MLILIDGYNVIAPAAPPGRSASRAGRAAAAQWLQAERAQLLQRLARQLDPLLAAKTYVIFDSASPARGGSDAFRVQGIHVRFAVDHAEADDLIEELIAAHHVPKRLTVVSSDHRLHAAARRAGATAFDSQPWLDALLEGKPMLAIPWPPHRGRGVDRADQAERDKPDQLNQAEIEHWLSQFAVATEDAQAAAEPQPKTAEPPPKTAEPPPKTGQGRGQGRAGEPTQQPAAAPPSPGQGQRRRRQSDLPQADPRPQRDPLPQDDNPFPEGYGEDLLP